MSYYIKPVEQLRPGRMTVYRVVKRLRDFKPDEDIEYMVFTSKKAIRTALFVDLYLGKNGKLIKMKDKSMIRF